MTPVGVVALSRLRPRAAPGGPHSRAAAPGRRHVGAYVAPDVAHRLRVLAAVEDTSTQALIEQAIEMLFQSRGVRVGASLKRHTVLQARRTRAGNGKGGRVEVEQDGCPLLGGRAVAAEQGAVATYL